MKQKTISLVIALLNRLTKKSFLYTNSHRYEQTGGTAVKDNRGVWHVGNVYNQANIAYGIAQNGLVEEAETAIVHTILTTLHQQQPSLSFYDIGANIGYYGLIASTKYHAHTYSFEPLAEYRACLEEAIKLNRTEHHHAVFPVALSDHAGNENFTIAGSGSSLERDFNDNDALPMVSVTVDTLDTVVTSKKLALPHFMKIDVEGHELAVLRGGEKTIDTATPVILLELCSSLGTIGRQYQNHNYEKTIDFLTSKGYQLYLIKDTTQLTAWTRERKVDYVGMFICLHINNHKELLSQLQTTFTITN